MRKLSPKQERFVTEYLKDLNATAAGLRSGYKHPDNGRQLLTKNHVLAAIEEAKRERGRRTNVSQDRVIFELACIAFSDPLHDFFDENQKLKPYKDIEGKFSRAISSIKNSDSGQELRCWDKIRALVELSRHLEGNAQNGTIDWEKVGTSVARALASAQTATGTDTASNRE